MQSILCIACVSAIHTITLLGDCQIWIYAFYRIIWRNCVFEYVLIRPNMGHSFWYICPYRYAAFPLLSVQGGWYPLGGGWLFFNLGPLWSKQVSILCHTTFTKSNQRCVFTFFSLVFFLFLYLFVYSSIWVFLHIAMRHHLHSSQRSKVAGNLVSALRSTSPLIQSSTLSDSFCLSQHMYVPWHI